MKLYAVLDVKAQLPVVVFQSNTDIEAERRFLSLLTTVENSVFTANPGDFVLQSFGEFSYHADCFTLVVESSAALTLKSGNDYAASFLDNIRFSHVKYDEYVQSYIDEQVERKYHEMLSNCGNLIADVKEDIKI